DRNVTGVQTCALPIYLVDLVWNHPEVLRVRRVSPGGFDKSRAAVKLRLGSINVGTMVRRSGEVTEMVGRRQLDFCCMQETKWKRSEERRVGKECGERW